MFFSSMVFMWASEQVKEPQVRPGLRQRVIELTNRTQVPTELQPMEDYLATHDTSILMYNRVPKTGSSSMKTMLINLIKVCNMINTL